MKTLFPCSALFLFFPAVLVSQAGNQPATAAVEPVHAIDVALGFTDFHINDEYVSPYTYGGQFFSVQAGYHLTLEHTRHGLDLGFGRGSIRSDRQPRDMTETLGYLAYSFLLSFHRLEIAGRQLELLAGIGLSTFVANSDLHTPSDITWFPAIDQSWYWSHALDIRFQGEYTLTEGAILSLCGATPIFRIVSRPADGHQFSPRNQEVTQNFLNAATGGKPEFIWDNLVISCQLEYRQTLSESFDLKCTYAFSYASTGDQLPLGMYLNRLAAGILWKI